MGKTYQTPIRLAKTQEGRIVPYEDPEAAFLYASPGQEIPLEEARAAGLLKQVEALENKMVAPADNKQTKNKQAKGRRG